MTRCILCNKIIKDLETARLIGIKNGEKVYRCKKHKRLIIENYKREVLKNALST